MVEKELLEILVCPDDLTPVRLASAQELEALNARIRAGGVKTRGGNVVSDDVKEGLVRADGQCRALDVAFAAAGELGFVARAAMGAVDEQHQCAIPEAAASSISAPLAKRSRPKAAVSG